MTIRMISAKAHLYAGRRLRVGDEFDARGKRDMRLLEALGRARRVVATAPPPTTGSSFRDQVVGKHFGNQSWGDHTLDDSLGRAVDGAGDDKPADEDATAEIEGAADMLADEPQAVPADAQDEQPAAEVEISQRTGKPKRIYRRRDMTAED